MNEHHTDAEMDARATGTVRISEDTIATSVAFALVGLTPVLLGLLTWDLAGSSRPPHNLIRLTGFPVAFVELIVIVLALRRGFEPWKTVRGWPSWMQAALLVIILIAFADAAFVAPGGLSSALRSCMALVHLLFALGVAHLCSVSEQWRGKAPWIAIVAGMVAYLALLACFVALIPDPGRFNWLHLGLGVMNIRHVGFFSAVGAAAALGLCAGAASSRAFLAALAAAAVMFGLSFWSGSRGPIAGVIAAFALGLLLVPALRTRRAVLALFVSVPAGAALSLLHSVPNPHYGIARLATAASQSSVEAASSGRIALWAGTWREILHRPLFGHGEGQLMLIVPEALRAFHHPHNAVLQAIFQWGFVGAACALALGLVAGRACYRNVRIAGAALACPFLVAATLLIMSLHDGTLFFGYPLMLVALSLGVMGNPRLSARH